MANAEDVQGTAQPATAQQPPQEHSQGTKRRLTPQQMELEKLQHEARQGMQKQLQVEGSIRAMPAEAVVASNAVNEAALAPHMPAMLSELSVDLPVGARRAHLSTCHGALLMGGVEHFVSTAGQRVCPDCQALCRDGGGGGRGQLLVERQRVRLLMSPVGVWSKARDFYTRWEALPGINAHARRFPLAGAQSGASLIVFKSAEQALLLDGQLGPSGTLMPLSEDPAFTMCSRAKTFCPCCNFASAAARGCVLHSSATRDQRKGPMASSGEFAPKEKWGESASATPAASEVGEAGEELPAEDELSHDIDITDLLCCNNEDSLGSLLGPLVADGPVMGGSVSPQKRLTGDMLLGVPSAGQGLLLEAARAAQAAAAAAAGAAGIPPQQQLTMQQQQLMMQQQRVQVQHQQHHHHQHQQQHHQHPQQPAVYGVAGRSASPALSVLATPHASSSTVAVVKPDPATATLQPAVLQQEQLASASTLVLQQMEELVSLLPPHYVISTVLQDRLVHLQLFKHLRNNPHARVGSHWEHHTDRTGKQALRLHLLFEDQAGSLAAVAGALSKAGVNILEAVVFCTNTGFALDIFSLSAPTPGAAVHADECIREIFMPAALAAFSASHEVPEY